MLETEQQTPNFSVRTGEKLSCITNNFFFYFRSEVFLQHMSVTHTDNTEQLHLFKK